jgi:hypothetical protein
MSEHSSHGGKKFGLILGAGLIAAAIAFGGWQIGSGFASKNASNISVTGQARTGATADSVVWQLTASESAPRAGDAVNKVSADAKAVSEYLTLGGIAASAISIGSVGTSANEEYVNGNDTGRVLSYRANQSYTVRTNDVHLVDRLSNGFGALLKNGANINNAGPAYYVSGLASLRPALLAKAMQDAKARAISITSAVGGKVGAVVSVVSGPVQVTTPDSVDASAGGIYDTSSIDKTVTVTVTASFKVN